MAQRGRRPVASRGPRGCRRLQPRRHAAPRSGSDPAGHHASIAASSRSSNDAVVALRGGLHHFDHARVGWVVTLGQRARRYCGRGARRRRGTLRLFDGDALAASMEEVGVGIQRASLPLAVLDVDLLDSLGGGGAAIARAATSSDASGRARDEERRLGRQQAPPRAASGPATREAAKRAAKRSSQEESVRPRVTNRTLREAADSERRKSSGKPLGRPAPEPSEDTEKKSARARSGPRSGARAPVAKRIQLEPPAGGARYAHALPSGLLMVIGSRACESHYWSSALFSSVLGTRTPKRVPRSVKLCLRRVAKGSTTAAPSVITRPRSLWRARSTRG